MKKFYLTAPIYYVNAPPHMGTGYTTILCDVLARAHKMLGHTARFVTGSDEHSQNIADKAQEQGLTPKAFCDKLIPSFHEAWDLLDIDAYEFVRTSSQEHKETVQAVFQKIFDQGDIYQGEYSGWYHTTDNRFVGEGELPEDPQSDPRLKFLTEKVYYFRLSKYQQWLQEYHQNNPQAIIPDFRRNEMLNRINEGLEDICISRSSTEWGIPLPWDKEQVFYVWVDALWSYITGSQMQMKEFLSGQEDSLGYWPCDLHVMAKDIPWFHTVIWPALLYSAGIPLPKQCLIHGYWNFEGSKMSKSLGNVFHPKDAVSLVGADGVRYFLTREIPVGQDGNFTVKALTERYNYDLANDLGNLCYRLVTMSKRFVNNEVLFQSELPERYQTILDTLPALREHCVKQYQSFGLKNLLEEVWKLVKRLNQLIDEEKPWELAKKKETQALQQFFTVSFESLRSILLLTHPILSQGTVQLWKQCGFAGELTELTFDQLQEGWSKTTTQKPAIVYQKLELDNLEQYLPKKQGESSMQEAPQKQETPATAQKEKASQEPSYIQFEDFLKVKMIAAKVLHAEEVPKSDKLLKITVDDGTCQDRCVVSGIKLHFSAEEMVGKTVCLVDNLKPRKIFGILSNGMILACGGDKGEPLRLVEPNGEVKPGTPIG